MTESKQRILSGMRTTGVLHLGNYHGALKNWLKLQNEYECFFFAADLHALTTEYASPGVIKQFTHDMIIDWLACGIDPEKAHIFVQSHVSAHSELHVLLSMITPLGWLERVPTYKDQQQKLLDKDLSTYGFLGYPVLQAADILLYQCDRVPVGEDQVPHIELVREIARRFNHLYGQASDDIDLIIKKLGKKPRQTYQDYVRQYQEQGVQTVFESAKDLLATQDNLSVADREQLLGHLTGKGQIILPEPEALLTEIPVFPGLDGQKMSKSYDNMITLRDSPESIGQRIKTMPTDPARVRRSDPGDPEKCPVWKWHQIYSNEETKKQVCEGCRSAGIGCLECKKPLIDKVIEEQAPILARAKHYEDNPDIVKDIIHQGSCAARKVANETLQEVHDAIGLLKYD